MDICLEKAQSSHRNLWSIFHDNILEMAQRRVARLEKRRRDTKSNYGRQSVWGSSFIANCPIARNQYETGIHHTRGSHCGEVTRKEPSFSLSTLKPTFFPLLLCFLYITFIFNLFLFISFTGCLI
jgi:hypothetical protein